MAKTANVAADEGYAAKIKATKIFRTVICVLLCIVSIFPFYIMIINATRGSAQIQAGIQGITDLLPGGDLVSNFKGMVKASLGKDTNVWEAMLHSAIIAVPATCLQVYFATFTAYGLTVYQFKLRNMAWSFIMAIMMIPAQVSVIGLMEFMTKIGLYNTYWPLIIPAIAAPSTVYFMKQYMQSALSLEIIEAARIDGSGELATFNKIALPLMKPAMATQAIFAFVASWNNLYVPNMMIIGTEKYTLPMFITGLQSDQIRMNYGFLYVSLTLTVLLKFLQLWQLNLTTQTLTR